MITVKSALADKSRIALFEKHPDHPGGELLVTGESEFQAAKTRAVLAALGDGRLVEVGLTQPARQVASVEPESPPPIRQAQDAPRRRRE